MRGNSNRVNCGLRTQLDDREFKEGRQAAEAISLSCLGTYRCGEGSVDRAYRFVGDQNPDCGTLNEPRRLLIFFTEIRQAHTYYSAMSDLAKIELIAVTGLDVTGAEPV